MGGTRRRGRRVEPTDEWEQLRLLCGWPEQLAYEEIRPLVLFGSSVAERAGEVDASERSLYRRVSRFGSEGMDSLFATERAKRRTLPPSAGRLVVDLKAEHPGLNPNEIARICYVRFGRRPDYRTVGRVLAEEPLPLRMVRRFPPYSEMAEPRQRRLAVVALHAEGWSAKAIAGYLGVGKSTVYRALRRWVREGVEGLDDGLPGRPKGVRKVGIKEIEAVRRMQQNPGLGAFRVHAALEQMGMDLSPATCGRILALNRRLYGLEAPRGPSREKKEMPFASSKRHEYWTTDVRYVDDLKFGGRAYVISVLDNHSRAILASSVSRTQDLAAFLSVLHRAVEGHGSPEALVTDGGAVFRANRALAVYQALGVRKERIERRRPWQSYVETHFNAQRRMADWHFARAESWPELFATHGRFVEDYNHQAHWAHREREDGRRSPSEVLGWVSGVRYRPEDLDRAFFSVRFSRVLDALGYATWRRWRLYGEEGLAGKEAALWLRERTLMLEHGGEPLSRFEVEVAADTGKPRSVGRARLFETSFAVPQPKLFALAALGEAGWLKAVKLQDYAPRKPRRPAMLQQALFPYGEAWG